MSLICAECGEHIEEGDRIVVCHRAVYREWGYETTADDEIVFHARCFNVTSEKPSDTRAVNVIQTPAFSRADVLDFMDENEE